MRLLLLKLVIGISFLSLPPGNVFAAQPERVAATLLIHLPADAKLTIDDYTTTSTSATRWFVTPPLATGKTFYYTLKAEFTRGSMNITLKEVVRVRAGQETILDLDFPEGSRRDLATRTVSHYLAGTVYRSYFPVRSSTPGVAPASEQDPMKDAGPPGSNSPLSLGVGQG